MKKAMVLAAMLALTVLAIGAPAAMADNDRRDDRRDNDKHFFIIDDDKGFDIFDDDKDFERFDFDGGELDQDVEQEAESGDVDQSFDVSQTGDNSNQTVGTQGVANTGNAQNATGVIQVGGDADDFEFDDGGSSIEVSPSSTTDSVQRVNQSASTSD